MPLYYFDVLDGRSVLDTNGTQLPDCAAARYEAIRLAGAVLSEAASRLRDDDDWHLEVRDERGLILFRLDFTIAESAGVPRSLSTTGLITDVATTPSTPHLVSCRGTGQPTCWRQRSW